MSKRTISPAFIVACVSTACSVETNVDRETTEDRSQKLRALPYTSWSPIEHKEKEGVVVNHAKLAYPGLNLFNSLVATRAVLMDMDGKELHA